MRSRAIVSIVVVLVAIESRAQTPGPISRWSFEPGAAGLNGVQGAPEALIEKALPADGREGKALAFEDWSVKDYVRPDPALATRVTIPHDPRLAPSGPFTLSAWIYPTADPIYYGGIVEKGRGYGGAYRLVLLRGLRVQASLGDRRLTLRSEAPLTLAAWHKVELRVEAAAAVLVLDGREAARVAFTTRPAMAGSDPLILGERFTGRIDEVALSAP